MSTDSYEFKKSELPQDIDSETPYSDAQWNFINDINSGVYSSQGLCLVQFNLESLYNSSKILDPSKIFITIPISIVSAYVSNLTTGALVAPTSNTSPWAVHGLKNGYFQLLHASDIVVSGTQIEQYAPYANAYVGFRTLSSMSQDDLNTLGTTLGISMDNAQSMVYNGITNQAVTTPGVYQNATSLVNSTGLTGGNGLVNNSPFPQQQFSLVGSQPCTTTQGATGVVIAMTTTANISVGNLVVGTGIATGSTVVSIIQGTSITLSATTTAAVTAGTILQFFAISNEGNYGDMSKLGLQGAGTYNNGYYNRIKRVADTTNGTYQNIYGLTAGTSIMSATNLLTEFKPTFQILNTNYMVTYDVAVIRLCDIYDSMRNMPLTTRFDANLRLYLNVGAVASQISATGGQMITSGATLTFTNTCPILQSSLSLTPATAIGLVSGVFVGKAGSTNLFGGVNLANSNASHPMVACRAYYQQITLKPKFLRDYLSLNHAKEVVHVSFLTNQYFNIPSGGNFNQLLQSGIKNIKSVIFIPYISAVVNGATNTTNAFTSGITTFSQLQSPFDTAPATGAPISLINVNVTVGGVSVLSSTPLNYNYEAFLEQLSLYQKINGLDLGLSCGLYNQYYFENNRVYFIDCSRGNVSDQMASRSVNVNFVNNSLQNIDCLIFTEFYNSFTLDVTTGKITKGTSK